MNDRAPYALLHGALRMIYLLVFFYVWRKSKRGGITGSHNLLELGQRIPWIVFWTTLCYMTGELIKIGGCRHSLSSMTTTPLNAGRTAMAQGSCTRLYGRFAGIAHGF